MKKARMHVRKKGFQQNLQLIAKTSAEHFRAAMSVLGQTTSMQQLAKDDRVDPPLRRAVKERRVLLNNMLFLGFLLCLSFFVLHCFS